MRQDNPSYETYHDDRYAVSIHLNSRILVTKLHYTNEQVFMYDQLGMYALLADRAVIRILVVLNLQCK